MWTETDLPGVYERTTPVLEDSRGAFMELWRDSITGPLGPQERFVQANVSRSQAGVLRGMHFHRRQVDVWVLVGGRAFVALSDLRGPSVKTMTIDMTPGKMLYIPRLVAHGFWAIKDITLGYLVSNEYDGTDELGFAWNDPAVGIAWPGRDPILSERDQSNPTLASVLALNDQQIVER